LSPVLSASLMWSGQVRRLGCTAIKNLMTSLSTTHTHWRATPACTPRRFEKLDFPQHGRCCITFPAHTVLYTYRKTYYNFLSITHYKNLIIPATCFEFRQILFKKL
jgi:hypothetical protein